MRTGDVRFRFAVKARGPPRTPTGARSGRVYKGAMAVRMTEVAAGVYRLEDVYTNCYLLEDGRRLTLVDAGLPADWASFTSALGRVGRSLRDVDAVLVTHHHPDHAGNAERLRASGARVLAHTG